MEFAYNSAPSATTGVSLFFTNKRYHLNITIYPECNIAFFQACNFAVDLNELQSTLKAEISVVQQCYQKSTNVQCSPTPDFKVDNKVFVKAQFFRTTQPSKKLSKISWTLQNHFPAWYTIIYFLFPRVYMFCSSSFLYVYT